MGVRTPMTHSGRLALSIGCLLHTTIGIWFSSSILVPVIVTLEVEAHLELKRAHPCASFKGTDVLSNIQNTTQPFSALSPSSLSLPPFPSPDIHMPYLCSLACSQSLSLGLSFLPYFHYFQLSNHLIFFFFFSCLNIVNPQPDLMQSMRDLGTLSPDWGVTIKPLPPGRRKPCQRGGRG